MNRMGKSRPGNERAAASASATAVAGRPANQRLSSGLKDLLWLVGEVEHGHVLDLGPVWQSTVSFFTERGFRVYTEDVLRAWQELLNEKERLLRTAPVGSLPDADPAAVVRQFLSENLRYPDETFHAILAWDLLDFLDSELLPRMAKRLYELLRPNGIVLAAFHAAKPEAFHRFRIVDKQTVELVRAPWLLPAQRVFQNREILNLFAHFRSSKTFVGRDQIREALFLK